MTTEIKIGVVGCGHIISAHLNGYRELKAAGALDGVTITALCNRNIDRALSFRQKGQGPAPTLGAGPSHDPMNHPHVWVSEFQDTLPDVYGDYREMFAKADINTVEIFTPVFSHYEIGMAAIDAGMNVFIEKPLAISVKAARMLVERAKEKGVTFGVAESFHYQPQTRMRKWMVDKGYIGTPQVSLAMNIGGFYAPDAMVGNTAWRHQKSIAGGGMTADAAVHGFHVMRYIYGEADQVNGEIMAMEPVRYWRDKTGAVKEKVICTADDTMACTVRFKSGLVMHKFQSWAGRGAASGMPQTDYGSKGCFRGTTISLDDGTELDLTQEFADKASPVIKEAFFPHGIKNIFALETLDFLNAIREGTQPETSGEEGLRDLALAFAVMESSHTGKRVKVADVINGIACDYETEINAQYNF